MRKTVFFVIALISALFLSACAGAPAAATPTPGVSPSPELPQTAAVSDFPAVSPSPAVSDFKPDTDIPDDLLSFYETAAYSNYYLFGNVCEDNDNIYYSGERLSNPDDETFGENLTLYRIHKADGSVKKISKDCGCYVLYNSMIYYAVPDPSSECCNTIRCFDPATGNDKRILKLKNGIFGIAGYNGKLYFTYETVHSELYDVPLSDLYSINPSGGGKKMITENVDSFSIYKDTIYYNELSSPEGGPLAQCNIDGTGYRQLSGDNNDTVIDIESGKIIQLPDIDAYGIMTGKYFIYLAEDRQNTPYVSALDTKSNRTYKLIELADLPDSEYDMYATPRGIYVVWADSKGNANIGRISIMNGKASFEKIAMIPAGANQ